MKYLSVCSGIEAATVAWHPLGWEPLAFSEIEPFPRKVLAHHYPDVPCHGDFTVLRDQDWIGDADLLVGGTPCQAFSVAGLRQSLSDDRGNLTLEFVRLADAIDDIRHNTGRKPAIIVWENVPGVLSVKDNAFGCFLAALVGNDAPLIPTGGKWTNAGLVVGPKRSAAWRILDAQYFGVAQRRRRVFVVAGSGDGFDPSQILFEFDGLRRDTAPSRKAGEKPAPTIRSGPPNGSASRGTWSGDSRDELITVAFDRQRSDQYGQSNLASTISARDYKDATDLIAQPYSIMPMNSGKDYKARETDVAQPLMTSQVGGNQGGDYIVQTMAVRRLTPRECERLQGFPDDYTAIPNAADGPRYKALGNSMAVPVMAWIGKRIADFGGLV